jgi:hypothetical protein
MDYIYTKDNVSAEDFAFLTEAVAERDYQALDEFFGTCWGPQTSSLVVLRDGDSETTQGAPEVRKEATADTKEG